MVSGAQGKASRALRFTALRVQALRFQALRVQALRFKAESGFTEQTERWPLWGTLVRQQARSPSRDWTSREGVFRRERLSIESSKRVIKRGADHQTEAPTALPLVLLQSRASH